MSYRCGVCTNPVPRGTDRRVHVVYRPGPERQIAQEIPVCGKCSSDLEHGTALAVLRAVHSPKHEPVVPLVVPPPPSVPVIALAGRSILMRR